MASSPAHRSRVLATPWSGVYGSLLDSGRHFGRHWHDSYGLGQLLQGAQRSASGRGSVDAFAGELITSNPGEVHDGRPLGSDSRRWRMLYLDPEVFAAMGAASGSGTAELTRPVITDARLRLVLARLFARLDAWQAGPTALAALACEQALLRVLGLLLERYSTAVPQPAEKAAAEMATVRERLADAGGYAGAPVPSLAELAAPLGLSRYQLLRRFEAVHGLPPHAWLLQLRAERARRMIASGSALAEAAAAAGFADQSHMTRVFARHFGLTPGAWRPQ
ncbi:AraC family transcriptional regulator [Paucibacter sp. PLA-PC-4]|uniref:AraC family transcriptional regulator n=1 Tax=Paucibacter sp. PLA-PC-4 TaxID=2993655 RepID=UPI002248F280|nr:AraC family transcriptional regulator [Paucibacter sp. PLA-PC-4]MCX2860792.1 AraC family transcriptional regulator [Paucibacter sp. PLA-PC-4]